MSQKDEYRSFTEARKSAQQKTTLFNQASSNSRTAQPSKNVSSSVLKSKDAPKK